MYNFADFYVMSLGKYSLFCIILFILQRNELKNKMHAVTKMSKVKGKAQFLSPK